MNAESFQQLIQDPSLLKDSSKAELEQLVYQYPWFGTAQFLLAAKLKQQADPAATKQIQKAAIFFNQPLIYNYHLNRFENAGTPVQELELEETFAIPTSNYAFESAPETAEEIEANDTDAAIDAEALIDAELIKEEALSPVSDAVLDADTILEAEIEKEELEAPVNDDILDAQALVNAEALKEAENLRRESDIESDAAAIVAAADQKEEMIAEQPSNTDAPMFSFEPFHTVDYFASQGIKLQTDKTGDDKLGQQVKSFTQWLKSMKKINVEEKTELDPNQEKVVVSMATESNHQTEVLTETMADVLIKQGKTTQAIDLYRKLSLLHPEKSVYFASRIEELKS